MIHGPRLVGARFAWRIIRSGRVTDPRTRKESPSMRPRTLLVWAMGVAAAALMLAYATAVLPSKAHDGRPAPSAAMASLPVRRAAPMAAVLAAPSAGPTAPAVATRRVKAAGTMPGRAGMVVGIDPETGQLGMPTAEQMAELSA